MAEQESSNSAGIIFLTFLAGAALGAGFALLAAPKTGRELRDKITDMTDDAVNRIKDYANDAQSRITATLEAGKQMVREKRESMASTIEQERSAMQ